MILVEGVWVTLAPEEMVSNFLEMGQEVHTAPHTLPVGGGVLAPTTPWRLICSTDVGLNVVFVSAETHASFGMRMSNKT